MLKNISYSVVSAALVSVVLAGCGGGTDNAKIQFKSQVSFGDSLSDVGSYAVGGVLALGGGRYTVNANLENGQPAPTNWTELMAAQLGVSAPCAAETGLNGQTISETINFSVPVVMHTPGCTAYAQGGAMVTYPYGPGNANVGDIPNGNPVNGSVILGQLTVPVVTQMTNHLAAHGGSYSGNEIVFVLAGGNDALFNLALYLDSRQSGASAVQAMSVAGAELASDINGLVLGKGAKYVVVLNLPDLSSTPFGSQADSALPGTKALINTMVTTFNSQLQAGLTSPDVLLVDAYSLSVDQILHPSQYGLSNVTDTACNLASGVNLLGSSLVCNAANVIAGDISHYEFADQVHPTPYGNTLIARYVTSQMANKGWL